MNNEKIGNFIKSLRIKNNFSQSDLAEKIHIGREAISKWENGKTIPDAQNLIILSEIFGVSIDELIYGKYITKENKEEAKDIYLKIYDDRNKINVKLKKTTKVLVAVFVFLIIVIMGFLFYYFFNSYDSVKIYTIESEPGDIYLTDGTIMLTRENIYFRLGNINGIEENKVSKVVVYYDLDNNKKVVYENNSVKDGLIRDYYGYSEYFEIEDKKVRLDSLYVDIFYEQDVKTIKLIMKEDYSNKRLFFQKYKNVSAEKKLKTNLVTNDDFIKVIKNKFDRSEDNGYQYEIKYNEIKYYFSYFSDASTLVIMWDEGDNSTYFESHLNLSKVNFLYTSSNKNSSSVYQCEYEYDSKNNCDDEVIQLFNNLIDRVINGGA